MAQLSDDKKERIRLLIEEGVSRRQICKMECVTNPTIVQHFGKSDRSKPSFDTERRAQVEELIRKGVGRRKICEELHISMGTLSRHLGLVKWNKKKHN